MTIRLFFIGKLAFSYSIKKGGWSRTDLPPQKKHYNETLILTNISNSHEQIALILSKNKELEDITTLPHQVLSDHQFHNQWNIWKRG